MIVLHDPSSAASVGNPAIRSLVEQRLIQLCGDAQLYAGDIHLIVVEAGDSVAMLEQEVGCPILHNLFDAIPYGHPDFTPCFEVLEEHPACYEMVFILTDGDSGTGIFIPKAEGINAGLLAMCAEYAVPAPALAEA